MPVSGAFAEQFLDGFNGRFLQCGAYDGDRLTEVVRPQGRGRSCIAGAICALRRCLVKIGPQQQVVDRRGCGPVRGRLPRRNSLSCPRALRTPKSCGDPIRAKLKEIKTATADESVGAGTAMSVPTAIDGYTRSQYSPFSAAL